MQLLISVLIALALTEAKIIYDKVKEQKQLEKDYNVLLGSYKQMGLVLVSENCLKQEEFDRFIKSKKEK